MFNIHLSLFGYSSNFSPPNSLSANPPILSTKQYMGLLWMHETKFGDSKTINFLQTNSIGKYSVCYIRVCQLVEMVFKNVKVHPSYQYMNH